MSRKIAKVLLSVGLLALPVVGYINRYNIFDWWRLRDYQPSARIVELADKTAMTDYARKVFYVHHPELQSRKAFNKSCPVGEASIVLGCYVDKRGIYIYDVSDSRLAGVHEVTAAHEMLHAVYARLSADERKRIDALTAIAQQSIKDPKMLETIQLYAQKDKAIVPNELHSMLATEVAALSPELEQYYSKYFKDRQKVVGYSAQYAAAFRERQQRAEAIRAQLEVLKKQINDKEESLKQQADELEQERARLDYLLNSNQVHEYNAAVPGFNSRVRAYNSSVAALKSLIDKYNRLVEELKAITTEENELINAIDSRVETIPTQ